LIGFGVVIAVIVILAILLSGPPAKPQLKITDKVTFVIGNRDGDNLGYITIASATTRIASSLRKYLTETKIERPFMMLKNMETSTSRESSKPSIGRT